MYKEKVNELNNVIAELHKKISKLEEKNSKEEKDLEEQRKRNAFIEKGVENIFNYDGTPQKGE